MKQLRSFQVSALNVVTHPHSPRGYVDLFKAIMHQRRPISIRGAQHMMLGELKPLDREDLESGLFGRIYRFDHIDPELPWFNVARHKQATEEEMAKIAIPENLVPNLALFDFVFFPKGHMLYFVSQMERYSLSPRSLVKMLGSLFFTNEILQKFGEVDITIIPDKRSLQQIFQMPRLTKLLIDVKRPNPDDNESDDEVVFERLARQGARRIRQEMTAEQGETILPDNETKILAGVAARNGKVSAVGYDHSGVRVEESTINMPWNQAVTYDPKFELPSDALINFALTKKNES
jgi:Domain of unknown function (DUF4747)